MISVILYGRNDSHGYNLHKRAAISLNCIAEMLSDTDDEILFVDYNTPNDLPTFIEAIYDTLTEKVKSLLRVLRVRPELHARMVAQTHLVALEPHSRNIAIRRSNPRNRWILFTNTDMIFLSRDGKMDLTAAVADLPDGHYLLPRFELPESLWELLPRSEPLAIMRACTELGPRLHLDEIASSHPYMRFDAPGDFQLIPRKHLFEIYGFDERMIYGWHADSNLCKRLYLFYGKAESLTHRLKGYHCDHTRVATLAHRQDIKLENDLQEFVYGVDDPFARHQATTWGAPEEPVEEVDFRNGPQARFVRALRQVLSAPQPRDYISDANDLRDFVTYSLEHVLPYVAGNLTVCPRGARFAYIGTNPTMLRYVDQCVTEMGFTHRLQYAEDVFAASALPAVAADIAPIDTSSHVSLDEHLMDTYDGLIFDFGLDRTGLNTEDLRRVTDWPRDLRFSLGAVARCFERCAERGDALRRARRQLPDFVVLNANHYIFRRFIGQFLLSTDTPYNTHVRKGRPRVGEERLYRSHVWKYTEEEMCAFFGFDAEASTVPAIASDFSIDLTSSAASTLFKDGHWGAVDWGGTWTDGPFPSIVFSPPPSGDEGIIVFVTVTEAFLPLDDQPIRLQVLLESEPIAHWTVTTRYGGSAHKALLPGRLMAGKAACRLVFEVENPQSVHAHALAKGQQPIYEDPRELGVKIQKIAFAPMGKLNYSLSSALDFTERGRGLFHLDEGWAQPDTLGAWTVGPRASLIFFFAEPVNSSLVATFTVNDVVVNDEHTHLDVSVACNGYALTRWRLGPSRIVGDLEVEIPPEMLAGEKTLRFSFDVHEPRTPAQLNWSADSRPLGFRLCKLRMDAALPPKYEVGKTLELDFPGSCVAFLDANWGAPDGTGCWTLGPRAGMRMVLDGYEPNPHMRFLLATFTFTDAMVDDQSPYLNIGAVINDCYLGCRRFGPHRGREEWTVEVPAEIVPASNRLQIAFEVEEPRSPRDLNWSDDARALGVRLSEFRIGPVFSHSYRLGEAIDMASVQPECLGPQWGPPDGEGCWTIGPQAELEITLNEPVQGDIRATFVITGCMVDKDSPELLVRVAANGCAVDEWRLGMPDRATHERSVLLPAVLVDGRRRVKLEFEIPTPRSPQLLGWLADERPLGIRIARAILESARFDGVQPELAEVVHVGEAV